MDEMNDSDYVLAVYFLVNRVYQKENKTEEELSDADFERFMKNFDIHYKPEDEDCEDGYDRMVLNIKHTLGFLGLIPLTAAPQFSQKIDTPRRFPPNVRNQDVVPFREPETLL